MLWPDFVPNAAHPVQDDQTFCPNCGTRVADPEGSLPASDFYPPFTAQEAGPWAGSPMPSRFIPNAGQGFGPRCATKKEFLMLPENKKLRAARSGGRHHLLHLRRSHPAADDNFP